MNREAEGFTAAPHIIRAKRLHPPQVRFCKCQDSNMGLLGGDPHLSHATRPRKRWGCSGVLIVNGKLRGPKTVVGDKYGIPYHLASFTVPHQRCSPFTDLSFFIFSP